MLEQTDPIPTPTESVWAQQGLVRTSVPGTLRGSLPAVPATVPQSRTLIAELARSLGAAEDVVDDIRLAVSEAVTNAVIHAYPDAPGLVHLAVAGGTEEIVIVIADDGCGLSTASRTPGLGCGLKLIAGASAQSVAAERPRGGTVIQLRFRLRGSAPAPAPVPEYA